MPPRNSVHHDVSFGDALALAKRAHERHYDAAYQRWTRYGVSELWMYQLQKEFHEEFGMPGSAEAKAWIKEYADDYYAKYIDTLLNPKAPPKVHKPVRYFLTFTVDPEKGIDFPRFQWWCRKEAEKKIFLSVELAYEHVEKNMHCHMDVVCKKPISFGPKGNFASYEKNVGFIKSRGPIKQDNGIQTYLDKEAEEIFSIDNTADTPTWHSRKVVLGHPSTVVDAPPVL